MLSVDKYKTCCTLANGFKCPSVNRRDVNCDVVAGGSTAVTNDGFSRLHSDSYRYGQSIYDAAQSGVTSYMEIDANDIPDYPILMLHYGQARSAVKYLSILVFKYAY